MRTRLHYEAPAVLGAAAQAGAQFAGMTMVRLPLAVAPLFTEWLERHYPNRKEKILSRIRSMRDGKLNSTRFGDRMRGHGPVAEQIRQLFHVRCRRAGLTHVYPDLNAAAFRRSGHGQLELWSHGGRSEDNHTAPRRNTANTARRRED